MRSSKRTETERSKKFVDPRSSISPAQKEQSKLLKPLSESNSFTTTTIPKRASAVVEALTLADNPLTAFLDTRLRRPILSSEPLVDFIDGLDQLTHARVIYFAVRGLKVRGLDEAADGQVGGRHDVSARNRDARGGRQGVEVAAQVVVSEGVVVGLAGGVGGAGFSGGGEEG